MCSGLLPAVLASCISCVVSDDQFHRLYSTLAGLPANLLICLQSVLNASARSIAGLSCMAYIINTLASFHLLCASEQIKFKLAVIVYELYTTLRRDTSPTR